MTEECPHCENQTFTTIVRAVQKGTIQRVGEGHDFVADKFINDVVSHATDSQGRDVVMCTDCENTYVVDNDDGLIPHTKELSNYDN